MENYIVSLLSSSRDDIKSFPTCLGLPSSCPEWHLYSDRPRGCGGCRGWETLLKRCICKWCGLCKVAQSPSVLTEGFLQRVTETSWCGCHTEVTTPEHGTDSRSCPPVCWEESEKRHGGRGRSNGRKSCFTYFHLLLIGERERKGKKSVKWKEKIASMSRSCIIFGIYNMYIHWPKHNETKIHNNGREISDVLW